RSVDDHRWLVDVQLAGDVFIVSAFIYYTGGVVSYFTSLYVLPIVAGSALQFRRGGLLAAVLSTVLYGGMIAFQYVTASGLLSTSVVSGQAIVLPVVAVAEYTGA